MIDNSTFFVLLFLGFFLMDDNIRTKIISKLKENKKIFILLVVGVVFLLK